MNLKSNKGFSLIELLVVAGINGILAAVAIPAYINYTDDAKHCVNESALTTAVRMVQSSESTDEDTGEGNFHGIKTKGAALGTGYWVVNAAAGTGS